MAFNSGAHPIHDIDDALYQQYFKIFTSIENGVEFNYYYVHLDGSEVTGGLATILSGYAFYAQWVEDIGGTDYIKKMLYKYDSGFFTPAAWRDAEQNLSHNLRASDFEDLEIYGYSKSNESGEQTGLFQLQYVAGLGAYGCTALENDSNSTTIRFSRNGIGVIESTTPRDFSDLDTLTNPEIRVCIFKKSAAFGYVKGVNSVPGIIVKKAL